jgi:hypothetical protein
MENLKELERKTYTEYINLADVYKIIQNYPDIFKSLPEERQKRIKDYELETGYSPITSLKKLLKQKGNLIHTKYSFSKTLKNQGRLFTTTPSLASMPREIRNTLAYPTYIDVDFVNCHPELLSQYCYKNNIRCNELDYYINNREEVLKEVSESNNISRDTSKHIILGIMNGGNGGNWKINKHPDTFLGKFKKEIIQVHKQICSINNDDYKKIIRRKDFNPEGTMINIILCKLEHILLINAVAFLTEKGYNVDVLVFDGFMVRKDKEFSKELLPELKKYLKDKTDYNMNIAVKEMKDIIDLSKFNEPVDENLTETTYYKDKEEFEKTHLKIIHPSIYISILKNGTLEFQNETQLTSSYRHKKTIVEGKSTNFILKWINDENIRLYNTLQFVPSNNYDSEDYNTWRGFNQENIYLPENFDVNNNMYVDMFKEFITNLLGGIENIEYINYFIAWCANIIQNPDNRSCVCMVLYSYEEGVGKNMIIKTIEKCIGEKYMNYISDAGNQLFGKHSSAEMNKLLISLNEVKGKDTYTNTDIFKTRITDDKREVELKGKETMLINNYCSYIINTNNLNMVNAGEKDRRFCVMDCNNQRIEDKLYFLDYEKTINRNNEAIRCIYEYLKNFDIKNVVPNMLFSEARPKTSLYKELVECNKQKEWDFMEQFAYENIGAKTDDLGRIFTSNKDLWNDYRRYCHNNNIDIVKLSARRFLFIFNRTVVNGLNKNKKYENTFLKYITNNQRGYYVNVSKLKSWFIETVK